ncbi:hypothetical protein [Micromonospora marina]|uniref:hypothetical protein n=1 Tax=Micromonospora marina TaxID=307120 RepID=UPI003D759CF5
MCTRRASPRDRLGAVLPEAELADVLDAIAGRRFTRLRATRRPVGAVLGDADNLDAIGSSGIARAYLWLGERHRAQAERLPGDDLAAAVWHDHRTLRRHWDEKLASLRGRMRTATGVRLAEVRHADMSAFVDRLEAETRALWPGPIPFTATGSPV